MFRTLKILFILLLCTVALLVYPTLSNAADKQVATSTINGINVAWEYYLNDAGQITNLVCTNASALSGNITIPSTLDGKTVVSLGSNSFKGSNITGVTIPDSVTEIGYYAFANCTKLTKVDLGSVTKLEFSIFKGCSSLTELTIPKTLKTGATVACLDNTNITKITFEDGLTVIPSYLCANTGITEITIPDSVTEIGYYAFANCAQLTKITILDNVKNFSFDIFKNHNEDLTIYCYQSSYAAKYAIENNIKVVYLPKDESNTPSEDKNNQNTNPGTNTPGNTQTDNTTPKTDPDEDSTTASGKLPYTGASLGIVMVILFVVGGGIFAYKKYNNLKDI